MRRPDPFFRSQKPHSNGYLESLHRQYGEPVGALPSRGDELFQRAYAFRQKEKKKYADLEREASLARKQVEEMRKETDQIRALFEQLSKVKQHHEPGSIQLGDQSVHEHADAGAGVGNGGGDLRVPDAGKDTSVAVGGSVPVEVLRPDGDVRGQSEEHTAEGPEPASGAGATKTASE